MKKTLALALIALVLTACAAPVVPAPVVQYVVVTATPAATIAATAADDMTSPKGGGVYGASYLVGSQIAPGLWQSSGKDLICWLTIVSAVSGNTVLTSAGGPGETVRIPSGDYVVVIPARLSPSCVWTFLEA